MEIIHFRSEVLDSSVSVDIFNPVSGLLNKISRIVTHQSRDASSVTLEARENRQARTD